MFYEFLFQGTCINNTSVMMFKKGSFEIGATVYPVAIKVTVFVLVFNYSLVHSHTCTD